MTASNEFEADAVLGLLAEADIRGRATGGGNPRSFGAGQRDIYVLDGDLQRAREVLDGSDETDAPKQETQPKGIDPKTDKPYEPVEIPVPKRSLFDGLLRRAETTPRPKGD